MNWNKPIKFLSFGFVLTTIALFAVVYAAPASTGSSAEAAAAPNTSVTVAQPSVVSIVEPGEPQPQHTVAPTSQKTSPTEKTVPVSTAAPVAPVEISSPKIGLDVPVIPVGLTPDHAVDVPNTLKLSGWYTGSPVPGATGSSLIDGHVGNSIGQPGVFANLHKLSVGDALYVKDKNGNTKRFIVKDMRVYPLADVPMATILENTSEKRLNIITCAGSWVSSAQTFDHRLVVYTELAD